MKRSIASLLFALPFAIWSSCTAEEPPATRKLAYPLKEASYSTGEIFIKAANRVSIQSLCDLSVFKGIWPGITAAKAEDLLGAPDRIYGESKGRDKVFVFHQKDGDLEIISQPVDSEGSQGSRWFLRWRPRDPRPAAYLSPELLAALPEASGLRSIYLLCGDGMVGIVMNEQRMDGLLWLRRGPETGLSR